MPGSRFTGKQVKAIQFRLADRERARQAQDEARRLAIAVGGSDPAALYEQQQREVSAYMGRDCQTYCLHCVDATGFEPPVPWLSDPDVRCAGCGYAVGAKRERSA